MDNGKKTGQKAHLDASVCIRPCLKQDVTCRNSENVSLGREALYIAGLRENSKEAAIAGGVGDDEWMMV